jgi:hypothetical protein
MKKKKLVLQKKVVASLSDIQKSKIIGGDDTNATYADCPTEASDCGTCDQTCHSVTCPSGCLVTCE